MPPKLHLKLAARERAIPDWRTNPPPDLPLLQQEPPSVVGLINSTIDAEQKDVPFFRPSMLSGCRRQNVFHYLNAPVNKQKTGNQLQKILDSGTHIHEQLQAYLSRHPGCFYAPEAKVWLPELEIRGSCDGVIIRRADMYRWGVEFKTISKAGFEALKNAPKPDHVVQASIYARITGVWWISVVYYCKDNSTMREFPIHYDPEIWEEKVVNRVKSLKAFVDAGALPTFDAMECKNSIDFCTFVRHCHAIEKRPIPASWGMR